jgi:hypothetical protein
MIESADGDTLHGTRITFYAEVGRGKAHTLHGSTTYSQGRLKTLHYRGAHARDRKI